MGAVTITNIAEPFQTEKEFVEGVANKFLAAVQHVGEIYRLLVQKKGEGNFVPEISMDETDSPQTPLELLIILAAIADQNIPVQTVAPKFTGRFNKGVDYAGDVMIRRSYRCQNTSEKLARPCATTQVTKRITKASGSYCM